MRLVYKHNQEHHFKIITYPDGQQNVELDLVYFCNKKEPIVIECSIRNFKELEVLICLVAALRKHDFVVNWIEFKYLFGMRSDRQFEAGQPNYFRDVVAPIINNLNVKSTVWYPHSRLSLYALNDSNGTEARCIPHSSDCIVIGADESACWHELFYDRDEPHFVKVRKPTGMEIVLPAKFRADITAVPAYKPIMVKDDLCDGGATFIAIAEYLKLHFPQRQRYLFVAHGLFTKGVDHVAMHYDKVFTTNSYQEFADHEKLSVIDVWKE